MIKVETYFVNPLKSTCGQSIVVIAVWGKLVGILRWEGIIISPDQD